MILKYRGYNKNWCYIEGDEIVTAVINTSGIASDSPDGYMALANKIEKDTMINNVKFIGEVLSTPLIVIASVDGVSYAIANDVYILNTKGQIVANPSSPNE